MSHAHELHCYDYVNHPYERVSDTLFARAKEILARASGGVEGRARTLATNLKVDLGPFEIGADVAMEILGIEEEEASAGIPAKTRVKIVWYGAKSPRLFPSMEGELVVYPTASGETQVELSGRYTPPMGRFGEAFDAVIGHKLAKDSVQGFVEDIARLLREEVGNDDD